MPNPELDQRSPARRAKDEQIASEPKLPAPQVPPGAATAPLEEHLHRIRRKPVAVEGVVENGLVRPIDPTVKLPERSRVIIVATEQG
jgi:hypothetical protein